MTRVLAWAFCLSAAGLVNAGAEPPNLPKFENCGWLVQNGDVVVAQPDSALKPSDPRPLAAAPVTAKAAYCERDTLMTYVGDERVIKIGLPLVLRSGDREGVLEYPPAVVWAYHAEGDHYVPGKKPD